MQIELLWIIPVVAFGFFLFLIAFYAQKRSQPESDLSREVVRFNNGHHQMDLPSKPPETRLGELESAISMVTQSVTNQQKMIDRFKEDNNSCTTEITELKNKLRDIYKEYDIVLSENYSLRAKVKKLIEQSGPRAADPELRRAVADTSSSHSAGKINMHLYEDTRLLNASSLDDTSEFDLSELR